jgi:cardiolipin synthase (CMP-forming)
MGLVRTLPNILTLLRIGLLPAWLALAALERTHALEGAPVHRGPVLLLMLLIGLTDFCDGLIARRWHLETNLGAMLDAVADKLASFLAVTFLAFFAAPAFTPLPVWLWAALFGRDLLLGTGYVTVWLKHRAVRVAHRWHGRAATFLLFVIVVAAFAGAPRPLVTLASLVVVALVVPGTWVYMREGWHQLTLKGG